MTKGWKKYVLTNDPARLYEKMLPRIIKAAFGLLYWRIVDFRFFSGFCRQQSFIFVFPFGSSQAECLAALPAASR